MQNKSLTCFEWSFLFIVCGFILIAAIAGLVYPDPEFKNIRKKAESGSMVKVYIAGAVLNPGAYSVPYGTSLKDAICLAKMLPEGRAWGYKEKERLSRDRAVYVPYKKDFNAGLKAKSGRKKGFRKKCEVFD